MENLYITPGISLEYETSKCVGCGRCVEVCPHAVFALERGKVRVEGRKRCMECGACARNCPALAISVKAGVGCAYAIINGIVTGKEPSCRCDEGCC